MTHPADPIHYTISPLTAFSLVTEALLESDLHFKILCNRHQYLVTPLDEHTNIIVRMLIIDAAREETQA